MATTKSRKSLGLSQSPPENDLISCWVTQFSIHSWRWFLSQSKHTKKGLFWCESGGVGSVQDLPLPNQQKSANKCSCSLRTGGDLPQSLLQVKLAANDSSKQGGLQQLLITLISKTPHHSAEPGCTHQKKKKKEGKAGCSVCLSWVDTPPWTQGFARILLFLIFSSSPICQHKQGTDKWFKRKMQFFFWAAAIKKISQQSLWFLSSGNYDKLRWGTDSTAWDPSEQCHRSQPIFQLPLLWVDGGIDSLISFIFLICYSAIKQIGIV